MNVTTAALAVAMVTGAGAPTLGGVSAPSAGCTRFRVVRLLRRSQPGACLQCEALRRRRTTGAQADPGPPALEFARLRRRRSSTPLPPAPACAVPRTRLSWRGQPDYCIARMMREPNRTNLTPNAPPLLTYGIGLLTRHELDRAARANVAIAWKLVPAHVMPSQWRTHHPSRPYPACAATQAWIRGMTDRPGQEQRTLRINPLASARQRRIGRCLIPMPTDAAAPQAVQGPGSTRSVRPRGGRHE